MSVDTPPEPQRSADKSDERMVLRREALLPSERSRGLGTVAVVCTMAGVASGLALATTLMAMQVADSMTVRTCPYRVVGDVPAAASSDHGYLGIRLRGESAWIERVQPGTPAEAIRLRPGDRVVAIDGAPIRNAKDIQERIFSAQPGSQPSLLIERDGNYETVRPTLAAWPVLKY